MTTNIRTLWTENKKLHIVKSVLQYSHPNKDINKNTYFIEWLYKGYLRIRFRMSKNQKAKFLKYGTIPSVPMNKINISCGGYRPIGDNPYKNNNYKTMRIGMLDYVIKLCNDSDMNDNKIYNLLINHILY